MSRKLKLFIIIAVMLASFFSITYYSVNKFYVIPSIQKNVEAQNTMTNNKRLSKDIKVTLFSNGKEEKEYTLSEIKKKLNINDDLNEADLIKLLDKEGYDFDSTINNEFMFKKKDNNIKPNKYYIGEKDGYLAIYKSDNNGKLNIEKESDVYKDYKTVDSLGKIDSEKIRDFKLVFSTRDEAEECLSEFLS